MGNNFMSNKIVCQHIFILMLLYTHNIKTVHMSHCEVYKFNHELPGNTIKFKWCLKK